MAHCQRPNKRYEWIRRLRPGSRPAGGQAWRLGEMRCSASSPTRTSPVPRRRAVTCRDGPAQRIRELACTACRAATCTLAGLQTAAHALQGRTQRQLPYLQAGSSAGAKLAASYRRGAEATPGLRLAGAGPEGPQLRTSRGASPAVPTSLAQLRGRCTPSPASASLGYREPLARDCDQSLGIWAQAACRRSSITRSRSTARPPMPVLGYGARSLPSRSG